MRAVRSFSNRRSSVSVTLVFVFRESNDEDLDVVYPDSSWLAETFGTNELDFLLEDIEEDIPWNQRPFYCIPGNPEEWSISVPLNRRLLQVPDENGNRVCPRCGKVYMSRFLQGQCRDSECRFYFISFNTKEDALSIERIHVDLSCWGECPRCRTRRPFASLLEQCFHCGRLLEVREVPPKRELLDNREEIREIVKAVADSDAWETHGVRFPRDNWDESV